MKPQAAAPQNLWLLLFFIVGYLLPLNNRLLWIPDESRYAEISREMLQSGDWVVPRLLGLRYFEKPIAGYWFNNLSQWLFGDSHFAVRFACALSAGLSAVLVFWFCWRLFQSQRKAFLSALCYLSFLLVYATGTYSTLDPMLTLWLNLAMISAYLSLQTPRLWHKAGGYLLLGMAIGMGVLTKGFLALAVPLVVLLPYLIYRRQLSELFRYIALVTLAVLAVCLPWALAIHQREPDYWHYFFWVEHVQRFAADNAQHKAPFWYYLPILLAGALPWTLLLPAAIRHGWQQTTQRPAMVYLLCWLLLPLLLFSIAKGKLPTYILPCFTPLAILLGNGLVELQDKLRLTPIKGNAWLNMLFGLTATLILALNNAGLFGQTALYSNSDTDRIAFTLALVCFTGWGFCGLASLWQRRQGWYAALCPLPLGLLLGWSLPASLVDSKLPEAFIARQQTRLADSRYIFSNDIGLAVSLGWQLKRDDIRLYQASGELSYGLQQAADPEKRLTAQQFPAWLQQAEKSGSIAVLTRNPAGLPPNDLPATAQVITQHRFTLFYYPIQHASPGQHVSPVQHAEK